MTIDVSFILTVFNKSRYLVPTIQSLQNQKGDFSREFIFVDDCSTDDSVAVIEQNTRSTDHVTIIRNSDNKGPSIRLNQGAWQARGRLLYLLDADDIVPNNAAVKMREILLREQAEVIYGRHCSIYSSLHEFVDQPIAGNPPYVVSHQPLTYIMKKGGFVRMGMMATKDLYLRSGGCDEQIFIQDESLPIRLCAAAAKLIDYSATVLFWIASGEGKNSANELQLHHDGFLAYRNAISGIRTLSEKEKRILENKMVSVAWKSIRLIQPFPYTSRLFADYVISKIMKKTGRAAIRRVEKLYSGMEGVRRLQ